MKELEEGQLVLCTVTKIIGTIVFVKIEDSNIEGTITFSEISPGRIRNIRDYVFPGKKIVCKILRIKQQGTDLSLRRVKLNEKKEFNDNYKKEKSYTAILKTILKEKAGEVIEKIKNENKSLLEFLEETKENKSLLNKYLSKQDSEKILEITKQKKVKPNILVRKFKLINKSSEGIKIVKETIIKAKKIDSCDKCEIIYLGAGKYMLKLKTQDPKQADIKIEKMMKQMEESSKKTDSEFIEIKTKGDLNR